MVLHHVTQHAMRICDVDPPASACPKRIDLAGNASLADGTLMLTSGDFQGGRASLLAEPLLPAELAGRALRGFRVELDLLYRQVHQSIPQGEYRLLDGHPLFQRVLRRDRAQTSPVHRPTPGCGRRSLGRHTASDGARGQPAWAPSPLTRTPCD